MLCNRAGKPCPEAPMGSLRDNHSREFLITFGGSKSNTEQVYLHHVFYDLEIIWVMSAGGFTLERSGGLPEKYCLPFPGRLKK